MNALTANLPSLRMHFEQIASSWLGLAEPAAAAGRVLSPPPTHALLPQEMLWLDTAPGVQVSCLDGCLLLQYQGRPRDVILVRGETHACDRSARLAVQAFVASELQVR
jgi:hypothetical protein